MGSVSPAPSNSEASKAVEVQWMMTPSIQLPCPAASSSLSLVKRDQANCLPMVEGSLILGRVDLQGARYGSVYAWVPQGAEAPQVDLGGRQLQAQFLASDSTARVCDDFSDCNVIWEPVSLDFLVEHMDDGPTELWFQARRPSPAYPIGFVLFENITLSNSTLPGSSPFIATTSTNGDTTSSHTSSFSHPLVTVPLSIRTLVGIIVSVVTFVAILLSLFLWHRRKRRKQDTDHPASESQAAITVNPFPMAAAAPSIPEHPSDSDGGSAMRNDKVSAALNKMPQSSSNPADSSPSGSPPTIEPAESPQLPADGLSASPTVSPVPASPRQVAQLTAALYRAGLSVNELMSSLDRVSRLDVDVHTEAGQGTAEIEAEVLPPRYEA